MVYTRQNLLLFLQKKHCCSCTAVVTTLIRYFKVAYSSSYNILRVFAHSIVKHVIDSKLRHYRDKTMHCNETRTNEKLVHR